jgi:DNA-directed RNA polymerase specialized sigma24 family protein
MSVPQIQLEPAPLLQQAVAFQPQSQRGKNFRHELLVELSVRGTRSAGSRWMKVVGFELEQTLKCLLGPDAPIEPLLESARFQALSAWPPPGDQPLSIWVRSIATAIALSHLKAEPSPTSSDDVREGGIREVLSHLYAKLRAARPQEHLAFALVDINGSSVSEAAAILRLPPATIVQCAARVRRQLLFAARRDRLLLRYLCIALRWQTISRGISSAASPLAGN